jgi:hypothetical protein
MRLSCWVLLRVRGRFLGGAGPEGCSGRIAVPGKKLIEAGGDIGGAHRDALRRRSKGTTVRSSPVRLAGRRAGDFALTTPAR